MRAITFIFYLVFSTFSFSAIASSDFVNLRLLTDVDVNDPKTISAELTNLSPQAIEAGLRDAEILASESYNQETNVIEIEWHSISKEIKGTQVSESFLTTLETKVKLNGDAKSIPTGQKLVGLGDPQEIIDAYNRMLKKAEENTEINNKELKTENTKNDYSNGSGSLGGDSEGGFFSGDGEDLQEKNDIEDFAVKTDPIMSSIEECPMNVDLVSMVITKQERTIKTSSETGEVVETTPCKSIGQTYPIRKDFSAGCSTKVDKSTGKYTQGHKLYSYVEGARYDISDCEWDDRDATKYEVKKDFESCDIKDAVIEIDSGVYQPPFIRFTMIDGQRRNLTDCETDKNETRALPVAYERCDLSNDFVEMKSYEQSRKIFKSPNLEETVKIFECGNTNKQYDIQKDFDVSMCANLPNYEQSKMLLAYKMFVDYEGAKKYVSDCTTSDDEFLPMAQEIGQCEAALNFTTNLATIQKRWFVKTANGGKEFVTDCVSTATSYPITITTERCIPKVIGDQNKVVLQSQKIWIDGNGNLHEATECRPTTDEIQISKEMCDAPLYEHDWSSGVSYYRSRDYYMKDGDRNYINECSRDPSSSFSHTETAQGCQVKNNDTNLNSQLYTKVKISVNGTEHVIRDCTASSSYTPYTNLGVVHRKWNVFGGRDYRDFRYSNANTNDTGVLVACQTAQNSTPFSYDTHTIENQFPYNFGDGYWTSRVYAELKYTRYRRLDGTIYEKQGNGHCVVKGVPQQVR